MHCSPLSADAPLGMYGFHTGTMWSVACTHHIETQMSTIVFAAGLGGPLCVPYGLCARTLPCHCTTSKDIMPVCAVSIARCTLFSHELMATSGLGPRILWNTLTVLRTVEPPLTTRLKWLANQLCRIQHTHTHTHTHTRVKKGRGRSQLPHKAIASCASSRAHGVRVCVCMCVCVTGLTLPWLTLSSPPSSPQHVCA